MTDTIPSPSASSAPEALEATIPAGPLSRRGFLRAATITGAGLVATTVVACAPPAAAQGWTYAPGTPATAEGPIGSSVGQRERVGVRVGRPLDGPRVPVTCAEREPAHGSRRRGPRRGRAVPRRRERLDGGRPATSRSSPGSTATSKVFDLTVDPIKHQVDAQAKDRSTPSGSTATWPGPRIDVVEGDKVRAIFKNNMDETTGIHFHGQRLPNAMDGVPHVTQDPIPPGGSFTLRVHGQVGGLAHVPLAPQRHRPGGTWAAGCVHRPAARTPRSATTSCTARPRTSSGSATTRSAGSRSTAVGSRRPRRSSRPSARRSSIRFMNEGNMMHPWHIHGMPMRVVARDGLSARDRGVHLRHAGRQPRRALGCRDRVRRARGVGVPLPHPPARRGPERDVRDGHRAGRPGSGGRGGIRLARAGQWRCGGSRRAGCRLDGLRLQGAAGQLARPRTPSESRRPDRRDRPGRLPVRGRTRVRRTPRLTAGGRTRGRRAPRRPPRAPGPRPRTRT